MGKKQRQEVDTSGRGGLVGGRVEVEQRWRPTGWRHGAMDAWMEIGEGKMREGPGRQERKLGLDGIGGAGLLGRLRQ